MIEHEVNIFNFNDYVDYLEEVYLELKSRNADYSQRDYARDLNIPAPRINQILNRKEGLSVKRASLISKEIDLSEIERSYFQHLVSFKTSKSKLQRDISEEFIENYHHAQGFEYLDNETQSILDLDGFDIVWNYIEVEPNLEELKKICIDGGLSRNQVNHIILEFIDAELIGVVEGRIFKKKKNIAFGNSLTSRKIQNFHKRKLKDSIKAVDSFNRHERLNESMTFSIRKEDVEVIRGRVQEFVDDLRKGLPDDQHNEVMTINIALYPSLKRKESLGEFE